MIPPGFENKVMHTSFRVGSTSIMADPRIVKMMDPSKMLFDCKRMAYGGFKVIVSA